MVAAYVAFSGRRGLPRSLCMVFRKHIGRRLAMWISSGVLMILGWRACSSSLDSSIGPWARFVGRNWAVLGGVVQFCALASRAPDAHFWTNEANKCFVCIVSENGEAKSLARGRQGWWGFLGVA